MIRVLVNGAKGKMGSCTVRAVEAHPKLAFVGGLDLGDSIAEMVTQKAADVVVDFTSADAAFENTKAIIEAGARPVIGSSGFTADSVSSLQQIAAAKSRGGLIAPNFAIGAVLMMRYSAEIARYFPDVEILEMHHENKADAPSGTAMKTAEMIARERGRCSVIASKPHKSSELIQGACGAVHHGVSLHSVRLQGFVAHQRVIFGGEGETLTIQHDSFDRQSFMPGVCLACEKVMSLNSLEYGLETILD